MICLYKRTRVVYLSHSTTTLFLIMISIILQYSQHAGIISVMGSILNSKYTLLFISVYVYRNWLVDVMQIRLKYKYDTSFYFISSYTNHHCMC